MEIVKANDIMALIQCSECNKEISDKAKKCPYCGCPNRKKKLSRKAKRIIIMILLIILTIAGVWYYNYEQRRREEALRELDEYIESLSYPPRPDSYEQLSAMIIGDSFYKPISPQHMQALRIEYTKYQSMGTPFKSTPFYYDWDSYKGFFRK
ncbi:hypothetical protein [uncultured Muribaculum sp.]|uniref:hypothetical protein n=2 Tax=uncultured Muribaculum sp. TaxID=1918613 RepID=UPI0025D8BB83|nr:hypothetical protein [uncultured Muribaculum sp.]